MSKGLRVSIGDMTEYVRHGQTEVEAYDRCFHETLVERMHQLIFHKTGFNNQQADGRKYEMTDFVNEMRERGIECEPTSDMVRTRYRNSKTLTTKVKIYPEWESEVTFMGNYIYVSGATLQREQMMTLVDIVMQVRQEAEELHARRDDDIRKALKRLTIEQMMQKAVVAALETKMKEAGLDYEMRMLIKNVQITIFYKTKRIYTSIPNSQFLARIDKFIASVKEIMNALDAYPNIRITG